MLQVGDKVVYGIHGVCAVVELEERVVDRKRVSYYVLEPVNQPGSRYLIPSHNPAAMSKVHKMLTQQEMEELLSSAKIRSDSWISEENRRKQTYRELISSGDRIRLMQMLHTLYLHRTRQTQSGKKVHLCDDNFLRDAEKLLSGEIGMVMELKPEEARTYLRNKLKEDA